MPEPEAYQVGIRSFLRWAEHLEDETHAMLSLLQYFEGREIKSRELWQSQVFPEIENFILPIRSINFPYSEFQAADRDEYPTPAVAGWLPAPLTRA
jgi:hypothetical protein